MCVKSGWHGVAAHVGVDELVAVRVHLAPVAARLERAVLRACRGGPGPGAPTSLGLRWQELERSECGRDELIVEVLGHSVRVKRRLGGASVGVADLSPEQDDLEALARETGLPLREVGRLAIEAALQAQADPSDS